MNLKLASHLNRKGDHYYVHQGITKTGKPRYFVSREATNALSAVPSGFAFTESINGVVSLHRPSPALIPESDLAVVRSKIASHPRLEKYRVEAKGKFITVYEPLGVGVIENMEKAGLFSVLRSQKSLAMALGQSWDKHLKAMATSASISVSDLVTMDEENARNKKKAASEHLARTMQYQAVMRFGLDLGKKNYYAERRCYHEESPWIFFDSGRLPALASKYIKYLGKDELFELI